MQDLLQELENTQKEEQNPPPQDEEFDDIDEFQHQETSSAPQISSWILEQSRNRFEFILNELGKT